MIATLPQLCAPGATVIWTRTRREPDLTPQLRQWLKLAGFVEEAFDAPEDVLFSVGVHRLVNTPQPLRAQGRLFQFSHLKALLQFAEVPLHCTQSSVVRRIRPRPPV